jgi:hypothetical protein
MASQMFFSARGRNGGSGPVLVCADKPEGRKSLNDQDPQIGKKQPAKVGQPGT